MIKEQKPTIARLRDMGLGYGKIGIVLDTPRDQVCNYCKAKGRDGYSKRLIEKKEWKKKEKTYIYRQCGNPIEINPDGRRCVCCLGTCRNERGKKHPAHFISTNVCFWVKSLEAALESKNSAAGIVMC